MTTDDASTIERVARAALGDPGAAVRSHDRAPLEWQAIASTTAELARYSGATDDGRTWSAVRKVLRRPESRPTPDWRREADVYASGVLGALPPGIVAPRLYAMEAADARVALWLEDIVATVDEWPLARYGIAARDLGRFNGAYLAGWPIPEVPTLRKDWLGGWVAMTGERSPEVLGDPSFLEHELVRRAASRTTLDRLRALHAQRNGLLAALDALPMTVSHLDAWRANLIARDIEGATETVAIDWSLLGLAPPGQEIAVFVTGPRAWLTLGASEADAIGELSLVSYIDGLRAAGWVGDEREVRFAYAASVALWAGIAAPLWLRWFTVPERRAWLERKFAMALEEAAGPFGRFIDFALDLGDDALAVSRA